MCYSAQVWADHRKFVRAFDASISVDDFYRTIWLRTNNPAGKIRLPKAMTAAFSDPGGDEDRGIRELIEAFDNAQATSLQQELFKQRRRLADSQRALQSKVTKAASESVRIASDKIERALAKLADAKRTELKDRDCRIFPGHYAPVMVMDDGRRVVKPMRYQCRPAGKPANYDRRYPGTYNARRDNLEGFWRGQFGHTHGIMVVDAFYENVARHASEHRELASGEVAQNVVLEFRPTPPRPMLVACLWSSWAAPGAEDLLSFAAITDEPPAEVAAAGHDRCIVPIREENIDAWLNPDPGDLAALHAILDDRDRPYYEHRQAA